MKTLSVRGLIVGAVTALLSLPALAQEHHTTVRWGPVHIPAATAQGPGEAEEIAGVSGLSRLLVGLYTSIGDFPVPTPCEDCYITEIRPNLVLPDGTTGNFNNGLMLHHVVTLNWSRPDITCRPNIFSSQPIKQLGGFVGGNERFFASGNERTIGRISGGHGYYVAPGDDWGLLYHLMNMRPEDRDVYFEFQFTWVDAAGTSMERVRPMWIDIDQCNDSEVSVPAGYSDVHWAWQSDRTHTVTDIGGHVHNYGISIAWKNQTTGQNACTSVAGYAEGSPYAPVGPGTGSDAAHPLSANVVTSDPLGLDTYMGNIADMSSCLDRNASVHKGDQMMAHTQIYRPDPVDSDMGIMVAYLDEAFCITNFWCF